MDLFCTDLNFVILNTINTLQILLWRFSNSLFTLEVIASFNIVLILNGVVLGFKKESFEGVKLAEKILRKKAGKGFTFQSAKDGSKVTDKETLKWIKSLVIPPAWKDVEINTAKSAKIHCFGRDDKGRKQYIYNAKFRSKQEKKKYDKIIDFAESLSKMRRVTGQHLRAKKLNKKKVLACMVRLLDNAYFRAGSDKYSKENGSYGLTTIRSKHLKIEGSKLIFNYKGKSGQQQKKIVKDNRLARIVQQIDELPGYEIFKYKDKNGKIVDVKSDMLNEYIRSIMGEQFSAKDFRTWAGTYLAAKLLNELGVCETKKMLNKNIIQAVDGVAAALGNTRSIARSSYIDPRIIERYSEGMTINNYISEIKLSLKEREVSSAEEVAVKYLLTKNKIL